MAEYTYKDVIIDPEDPRVETGKEYYFGDNVGKLLWGVRTGWKTEVLHNVFKDAGIYEPFYNGRANFSCIIRKKEQSYEERQAEWIRENNLKAGDKVRILKQFNVGERGVPFGFNDAMLSLIGDICEVFEIADNRIRVYDKHRVTYWVWPYFCLEKVVPEYIPFDLSKEEDRDALRGKWVKSKDPDYFYEYQITKFDQADHEIFINFEDGRTSGDELLKDFVFLDGSPVGKLKEDFDEG